MRSPVPVWVWVDYPRVPRYIALNLQLIHKYAPPPHSQVHLVTCHPCSDTYLTFRRSSGGFRTALLPRTPHAWR